MAHPNKVCVWGNTIKMNNLHKSSARELSAENLMSFHINQLKSFIFDCAIQDHVYGIH